MKKTMNLLLALAFFASCMGQKETLELNLVKGQVYKHGLVSNVMVTQNIKGQEVTKIVMVGFNISYKVMTIENSIYDLEVKYERLLMNVTYPNGAIVFDSDKSDNSKLFTDILSKIKNRPFYIQMTKTGKVIEIKNMESLFTGLFENFPQLPGGQKKQIQYQLIQAYGEKALKNNMEMVLSIFPESPVAQGGKWTIKTKSDSVTTGDMETVYELNEISDSYYRISGHSKISTANMDAYIKTNDKPVSYTLSGTMSIQIKINKKTGWVKMATINEDIKGTAQVQENLKNAQRTIIPLVMSSGMCITD